MNKSLHPQSIASSIPDFLIKSSFGCTLVVTLILIPFTINNFIQHRFIMGLVTSLAAVMSGVSSWHGFHGRYSLLVNTWLMSPVGALTIIYVMTKLGAAGSYWPFLLVVAYYFVLPEKRAWFFNALTLLLVIPMAWMILDQSSAVRFVASLLAVSLFALISMREINILHGVLKEQAVTDKLTGLFNRMLLEDTLHQAIAQSRRSGVPVALIILDVDHFKSINDALGHDTGDFVLKKLGDLLRRRIRGSDRAFRIGGEEFLVLVHNAGERQGIEVAEVLRQEVGQATLLPDRQITISAGVSSLREGMDATAWMKDCDEKLYRAKETGRNRVVA